MTKAVKMVKKRAPQYSFPAKTDRVFADYKHKTIVPSPDTYFKEAKEPN